MNTKKRMSWLKIPGITASLALLAGSPVFATSTTQSLSVTASVSNTCAFNTVNSLAFGAYDPTILNAQGGSDLSVGTTFSITCTNNASVTIGMDSGLHESGGSREMVSGANSLSYALYQDANHGTGWGNNDGNGAAETTTGTGAAQTINVYGVVPKGQSAPNGTYSDTVTITLTY
jgi:spore coat protein U-like protein